MDATENFREHLSNVDEKGKRLWIYPKIIKGIYYKYRTRVSYIMLAFLFVSPFIKINNHPLFLINVIDRKFILFGVPFWPQDMHLLALALLTFLVFIILFTAIFGRFFCGWACPQTIFMEMVFRKIEHLIEGNAKAQKLLNESSWTWNKIKKKTTKHALFWSISFAISNTFLAWIIGVDALILIVKEPINKHILGFISIIVFTTIFYLVFAKIRELVCTMICPYGRLQGVLLDQNSLVVAYDYQRGEPRGKIEKKKDLTSRGDCVNCNLCVDVCPTGIDIRNGTQLECIHCTACMDACDGVMKKIQKPLGLIRYASESEISSTKKFKLTPRIKAYSVLLLLLTLALLAALFVRKPVQAEIIRQKGTTYIEEENGVIANIYEIRLVNKKFKTAEIKIVCNNKEYDINILSDSLKIISGEQRAFSVIVRKNSSEIDKNVEAIAFQVYSNGNKVNEVKSTFLAPIYSE